jgi:hypothetical protein
LMKSKSLLVWTFPLEANGFVGLQNAKCIYGRIFWEFWCQELVEESLFSILMKF